MQNESFELRLNILITKAVVMSNPGKLAIESVELKECQTEDVVVDIHYSGISTGTEKLFWNGKMPAFPGMGYPLVPGYESTGEVVQASKSSGFKEGDIEIHKKEILFIIENYTYEAGVRKLKEKLYEIVRHLNLQHIMEDDVTLPHRLTTDEIEDIFSSRNKVIIKKTTTLEIIVIKVMSILFII